MSEGPLLTSRPPAAASGRAALWAGATLLGGACLLAFGWLRAPASPAGAAPATGRSQERSSVAQVQIAEVRPGSVQRVLRVPGEWAAASRALLRARNAGAVVQVRANLGDLVAQGDELLALDAAILRVELARAQAATQVARVRATRERLLVDQRARDHERKAQLRGEGALSSSEEEQARLARDLAVSDAELAEAELARATAEEELWRTRLWEASVRAPFAGRVVRRWVDLGSTVGVGDALIELVSEGEGAARFAVPEGRAARMQPGERVWVESGAESWPAVVTRLGAAVDASARTVWVEAQLAASLPASPARASPELPLARGREAPAPALLPGAFLEVRIEERSGDDALVCPLAAIRGEGALREVWWVDADQSARRASVRMGLDDGEWAVLEGLPAGSRVIVSGGERVREGQRVEIVP